MRTKPFIIVALALLLTTGFFMGASAKDSQEKSNADPRPHIVTTTAQIADAVRSVVGDTAQVSSIMGEGVDPHLYRPTRTDILKLKRADMVFYNGLHLEGQMVELLETLAREKPVYPVAAFLPATSLLDNDAGHDPHIWMNVSNWITITDGVIGKLSENFPQHAQKFVQNAIPYKIDLARLDSYIRQSLSAVPHDKRVLVTAHDAFAYLGNAYDLRVIGIQGISTESEAGLKKIEEIVTLLAEKNIPAVFIESSVSDRNVKALIEGAAARGHSVTIGGTLYSDAMGTAGTYEGTYIGMMDHNATAISRALGASTSDRGMNGKLSAVLD